MDLLLYLLLFLLKILCQYLFLFSLLVNIWVCSCSLLRIPQLNFCLSILCSFSFSYFFFFFCLSHILISGPVLLPQCLSCLVPSFILVIASVFSLSYLPWFWPSWCPKLCTYAWLVILLFSHFPLLKAAPVCVKSTCTWETGAGDCSHLFLDSQFVI